MGMKTFAGGSLTWEGEFDASLVPAVKTDKMVDQDDFKFIRMIGNLILNRKNPNAANPKGRLRIELTTAENRIGNIKVAYWKSGWIVLSQVARDPASVTVEYNKIGDPPIGVGH